jgi:hypothetical protein
MELDQPIERDLPFDPIMSSYHLQASKPGLFGSISYVDLPAELISLPAAGRPMLRQIASSTDIITPDSIVKPWVDHGSTAALAKRSRIASPKPVAGIGMAAMPPTS